MRSLLPFPITVIFFSSNFISEILIPTNSERRSPQFKNNVIIAKSRDLFIFESSLYETFNSFSLSVCVKYLGNLLFSLGVSKY